MTSVPVVRIQGLKYQGNLVPHIYTSSKKFTFGIQVPFSISNVCLDVSLMALPRTKAIEEKYAKTVSMEPRDPDDFVNLEESVLCIQEIVPIPATIQKTGLNSFLCATTCSVEHRWLQVTCQLSRNHWERNLDKFMMFILQIRINDVYFTNLRVYAQKGNPVNMALSSDTVEIRMMSFIEKQSISESEEDEEESEESEGSEGSEGEVYERSVEKRSFTEFEVDTSPLPPELIVSWSKEETIQKLLGSLFGSVEQSMHQQQRSWWAHHSEMVFSHYDAITTKKPLEVEYVRESKRIKCE